MKEYQRALGVKPPELDEAKIASKKDLKDVKELHDYPMLLNSSYYLSPLLLANDSYMFTLEEKIKKLEQDLNVQRELSRKLMDENDMLAGKVEKQNLYFCSNHE
jgi:hypothetical protein